MRDLSGLRPETDEYYVNVETMGANGAKDTTCPKEGWCRDHCVPD